MAVPVPSVRALDAVRGMQHVVEGSVLCWRSAVYLWQGRWLEARETARRAQNVAERLKTMVVFGMSRSLGAYAGWMLQRQPESVNALVEATTWLEGREKTLFRSLNYGWLAEVMQATGQFEEARRYGARAMARARQDDCIGEAMAWRALARVAMSGHTKRTPAIYLARANRVAEALGSPLERALNLFCEAEIAASSGEPGPAACTSVQSESLRSAVWAAIDGCRAIQRPLGFARGCLNSTPAGRLRCVSG